MPNQNLLYYSIAKKKSQLYHWVGGIGLSQFSVLIKWWLCCGQLQCGSDKRIQKTWLELRISTAIHCVKRLRLPVISTRTLRWTRTSGWGPAKALLLIRKITLRAYQLLPSRGWCIADAFTAIALQPQYHALMVDNRYWDRHWHLPVDGHRRRRRLQVCTTYYCCTVPNSATRHNTAQKWRLPKR